MAYMCAWQCSLPQASSAEEADKDSTAHVFSVCWSAYTQPRIVQFPVSGDRPTSGPTK